MSDGLAFSEDYVDGTSDVIEMLWGRGKHVGPARARRRGDVGGVIVGRRT